MVVLLGIAFLAGVITAFTPCILPVLPILLAGGSAGGSRRRPYAIVAGLVTTFTLFTLAATWIFRTLGLSLKWQTRVGVAMLLVLAAILAVPRLGVLLERPFALMTRRRPGDLGGGYLLGASLGLVFVPCAGPVFGAVATNVGSHRVGFWTVADALAYAIGAALPMLVIVAGGRTASLRLRARARPFQLVMAGVMAVAAIAIWRGWETNLQTKVPSYAASLQHWIEGNGYAKRRLDTLRGNAKARPKPIADLAGSKLPDYGPARPFLGIAHWLNTPGDTPLTMEGLRGKVVLVDFWTYSCINCLRTLPYLESWDRTYRKDGLVIVGVHTPEFGFEHVLSNVRENARRLGVRYPVALDNDYDTWNVYSNEYWPADYLIDRRGHIRDVHFGEGGYDQTEAAIRKLLAEPGMKLPSALDLADRTPTGLITPESYLGYGRLARYAGSPIHENRLAQYELPFKLDQNELAYGGFWKVESERIVAGRAAALRLHFHARKVHLVLGGSGRVQVLVDGTPERVVRVTGDRLYTLVQRARITDGLLELQFTPGVQAYAFTFG